MYNYKLGFFLLFAIGLVNCIGQPPTTLTEPTTVQPSLVSTTTDSLTLAPDNGFKISIATETTEGSSARVVYILEEKVVEMEADTNIGSVMYSLRQKSWKDLRTGRTTTFLNCLSQLRGQVRNLKTSFATEKDKDLKAFALGILEPKFEIETGTQGELIFQNEFIKYTITSAQHLDGDALMNLLVYNQLDACRTADPSKDIMSFARLEVADELVGNPIYPNEIKLIRKGFIDEFVSRTLFVVDVMTAEETQVVESVISNN